MFLVICDMGLGLGILIIRVGLGVSSIRVCDRSIGYAFFIM